ncbi:hypothetical protein [Acinetobacter johnsonii]|uniref:hypothetical protein n=1 Tax=Acinetobacter johnsonii TaxID=40214 RepID=UPI00073877D0|nr:hypothetical protein [Acinetobacter johnsonii]KUG39244.1 hypothetical protein AAU60_06140 [Acinetobacter johnsonii]
MASSLDVNHAIHSNTGAPQLTNSWGSLTALLDAVLVNGYSEQIASKVTSNASGVVTISFAGAHKYLRGQILKLDGNSHELKGKFRIQSVTDEAVVLKEKISANKTENNVPVSVAPFGYEIAYSKKHKRAYKSLNPNNVMFYIVDDALWDGYTDDYAKIASCGLATNLTDIDSISGYQCPFDSTDPHKNWSLLGNNGSVIKGWAKWCYRIWGIQDGQTYLTGSSGGAGSKWQIVGNDEFFYLALGVGDSATDSYGNQLLYGAGKYDALDEDNSLNYFLSATINRNKASDYQSIRSSLGTPDRLMPSYLFANEDGTKVENNQALSVLPNAPDTSYPASSRDYNSSLTYNTSESADLVKVLINSLSDKKCVGSYKGLYAPLGAQERSALNHGKTVVIDNKLFVIVTYYSGSGSGPSSHQSLIYVLLDEDHD